MDFVYQIFYPRLLCAGLQAVLENAINVSRRTTEIVRAFALEDKGAEFLFLTQARCAADCNL